MVGGGAESFPPLRQDSHPGQLCYNYPPHPLLTGFLFIAPHDLRRNTPSIDINGDLQWDLNPKLRRNFVRLVIGLSPHSSLKSKYKQ